MKNICFTLLTICFFYSSNLLADENISQESNSSQKKEIQTTESSEQKKIEIEEVKEELVEELEITDSSMGLEWKDSYTEALVETFEHRDIQPIFDITIHHEDLEKIGCVNYNDLSKLEKMKFLVVYMSAIAEAESDYRTRLTTTNWGDRTTNIGMLQIDVSAARHHTKSALGEVSKEKLKDPHFNLKVGVFVFKNQVLGKIARGRFFPKRSYYWQVLTYPKRLLKTVERNKENLSFCRE